MPLPALLPLALAAGGGALFGGLFGKSGEKPSRNEQIPRFTPQQQSVLASILGQAQQGLQPQNFGAGFEPIAQQQRNQFQQETVPLLAERFTAMGGGQRSSAFSGALGSAASGLEQSLGAQKANFGLQQQGQLQNLLGLGLQPQFETVQHQRQPGLLESISPAAIQALLMYLSGGTSGLATGAGIAGLNAMGNQNSVGSTGFGNSFGRQSGYGSGFANPALQSPGMQNIMRGF